MSGTQLTPHFSSSEFDVSIPFPAQYQGNLQPLAQLAEWLRSLCGTPGYVTSAYRTATMNAADGGSPTSQHLVGEAIDVEFLLAPLRTLAQSVLDASSDGTGPAFGQCIFYADGHVHISLPTLPSNGQVLYADSDGTYPQLTDVTVLPLVSGAQKKTG